MHELIEAIRAAVADGASADQKAVGARACQTILTALGAEPGRPIALPGAPEPSPLARLSGEQALDLVITRLASIAEAREANTPPPSATRGPRIALVQAPATARIAPIRGARPVRRKP